MASLPPPDSLIPCTVCAKPVKRLDLNGHLAAIHFDYHRHKCIGCNYYSADVDEMCAHAVETRHRVELNKVGWVRRGNGSRGKERD